MEPVKEPTQEQRKDNNLRAEIEFFDALTGLDLDGSVYYDVKVVKQVDAFAWFTDKWRCAIEVKGGQHMVKDGTWYLHETNGNLTKLETSPPDQALAAAMAVRTAVKHRLDGHEFWINVILVLTGMPVADNDIKRYANDRKVDVIWGLECLEEQLLGIINKNPDRNPPDALDILAESAALNRSNPPAEWVARRTAQSDLAVPSQSQGLPVQSGGSASRRGIDAAAGPTYSFEIHNDGTLNIYLCDSELSAFTSDGSGSENAGVEPPVTNIPNPSTVADDDGVGIDAPPHPVPDPFDGDLAGDGFDDSYPFS